MIKRPLLLLAFIFVCLFARANKVDDLKTDSDVVKFITSSDKMFTQRFAGPLIIRSLDELMKSPDCDDIKDWQVKNWEKIDLNKDGHNDLLVNASWSDKNSGFVTIDRGDNTFKIIILHYSPFGSYEIARTTDIDKSPAILFHYILNIQKLENKQLVYIKVPIIDTLIYKFDDVIELTKKSDPVQIDSIKFETGYCGGTCPVFSINIGKAGAATYKAGAYDIKKGTFRANIHSENLNYIYDLMSYLNIKKLNNNYDAPWFDAAGCSLIVNFSDGTVKTIKDYGEIGTFGLRKLYSLLFALRTNQNWQTIN